MHALLCAPQTGVSDNCYNCLMLRFFCQGWISVFCVALLFRSGTTPAYRVSFSKRMNSRATWAQGELNREWKKRLNMIDIDRLIIDQKYHIINYRLIIDQNDQVGKVMKYIEKWWLEWWLEWWHFSALTTWWLIHFGLFHISPIIKHRAAAFSRRSPKLGVAASHRQPSQSK